MKKKRLAITLSALLIAVAVLVDVGDHIQGTAYGSMDNGATIIALGHLGVDASSGPWTSPNYLHNMLSTLDELGMF